MAMPNRFDELRDYAFADRALALRQRAGLTQPELASLLRVGLRSIQAWEAGLSYPGAERLQQLIALYLKRGEFAADHEQEEACALWEAARTHAARRIIPFDWTRFESRRGTASAMPSAAFAPADAQPHRDNCDDVPDAGFFYGRADELQMLSHWLRADRCRLAAVLGTGGIGKTFLAARLARDLAPDFTVVYWRSLRNALPVDEWLSGAIGSLSGRRAVPPDGQSARLDLLVELVQRQRGLLVLDNLETVLESGTHEGRYRDGYDGYGEILRRLGETVHQSCLLVTAREPPLGLSQLARERGPVRILRLGGLGQEAARALLQDSALVGDEADWERLIAHYRGNPLALSIAGETIGTLFDGKIAGFLEQGAPVFGGIRQLLDEQVDRLSPLERTIANWLALAREPVGLVDLAADLGPGMGRGQVLEAVAALQRRSLLEQADRGTFTLQPVVLEYVTGRLVEVLSQEILAEEPSRLANYALVKARAPDFVRRSQERMIALPVLDRLRTSVDGRSSAERHLLGLLDLWRARSRDADGYGPGNVVNLLRLLRRDVRGLDFSGLTIRQAYLQEVEVQDASLAGAHLAETVLGDSFAYPTAVALSSDGAYLAAGTPAGELRLWRTADRTALLAVQAHTSAVWGVAVSSEARLVASGSADGTVRLWDLTGEQPVATLQAHSGAVWGVAISSDGSLLASGGDDGTVRLWELSEGRPVATFRGHTGAVWGVAIAQHGRLVASCGVDGTIRVWARDTEQPIATMNGHAGAVCGVALSGDGRTLASGGVDGTVRVWTLGNEHPFATLTGHSGLVWRVAISGGGRHLVSGGADGTVRLWEATSGQSLATLAAHTSGLGCLAFRGWSPVCQCRCRWDGALVADQRRTAAGNPSGPHRRGYSVALSGDRPFAAGGGADGTVRLWEADTGRSSRQPARGCWGRLRCCTVGGWAARGQRRRRWSTPTLGNRHGTTGGHSPGSRRRGLRSGALARWAACRDRR